MNQWTPIFNETSWDHGLAPTARELGEVRSIRLEPICSRCTTNGTPGDYCTACVAEIAHSRDDVTAADPTWDSGVGVAPQPNYCVDMVRTVYTGHGINHGTYRPDVTL